MNFHERRTRLIGWLDTIFVDVQDLMIDDHLFWEVQKIVEKNPAFSKASGLFTQWVARSFVEATAVGIRRQLKAKDSVSLRRLLEEVRQFPELVSREHYMTFFKRRVQELPSSVSAEVKHFELERGNKEFDRLAGAGAAHVPATLAEKQIAELESASERIEHYVDRRVAHYDQRGLAQPLPTFDDMTQCLKTMDELIRTYWLFLKGLSMSTVMPTILVDWTEIFAFAWAPRRKAEAT